MPSKLLNHLHLQKLGTAFKKQHESIKEMENNINTVLTKSQSNFTKTAENFDKFRGKAVIPEPSYNIKMKALEPINTENPPKTLKPMYVAPRNTMPESQLLSL